MVKGWKGRLSLSMYSDINREVTENEGTRRIVNRKIEKRKFHQYTQTSKICSVSLVQDNLNLIKLLSLKNQVYGDLLKILI